MDFNWNNCLCRVRRCLVCAALLFAIGCTGETSDEDGSESGDDDDDAQNCLEKGDCADFCNSQTSEEGCTEANGDLPMGDGDDFTGHGCVWRTLVESAIDQDGNCQYGGEKSFCEYGAGIGEDTPVDLPKIFCNGENGETVAFYAQEEGMVYVGTWKWSANQNHTPTMANCVWNTDDEGSPDDAILEGVDECACVCDPQFPDN